MLRELLLENFLRYTRIKILHIQVCVLNFLTGKSSFTFLQKLTYIPMEEQLSFLKKNIWWYWEIISCMKSKHKMDDEEHRRIRHTSVYPRLLSHWASQWQLVQSLQSQTGQSHILCSSHPQKWLLYKILYHQTSETCLEASRYLLSHSNSTIKPHK